MAELFVSIFDSAVMAYQRPFVVRAKGEAIRAFSDEVNREGSDLGKHPDHYTLFVLGSFDPQTGLITPLPTPEPAGKALEFVVV